MINDNSNYPIGLTFARPFQEKEGTQGWSAMMGAGAQNAEITMEESETVCVAAESPAQLGLVLETINRTDIVVKDLDAVPGPFQSLVKNFKDRQTTQLHLSVDAVNGEFVPSFANAQMVKNAMERSWKSQNCVEVVFCDDERKQWAQSLQ
jgi:hypothetical protein